MSAAPTAKVATAAVAGSIVTLILGGTDRLGLHLTGAEGSALGVLVAVALAYLVQEHPTLPVGDPIPVTLADEPVQVVQVEPAPADLPVPDEPVSVGEAAGVDATAGGGSLRAPRVRRKPL